MPILRPNEKMKKCEMSEHSSIRTQKYYIQRSYYNEIEKHFCQGCLNLLELRGLVTYIGTNGYEPAKDTSLETLLSIYGE